MSKVSEDDSKKLGELSAKAYKAQAIWFLNANWTKTFESDEEQVRLSVFSLFLPGREGGGGALGKISPHLISVP